MNSLIEQLSLAHKNQKQQIADSFHDGLILFSLNLKPHLINQKAQSYIKLSNQNDSLFKQLEVYSHKRDRIQFDVEQWLKENLLSKEIHSSPLLWIRCESDTNSKTCLIPIIIKAHKIQSLAQKTESLLILIQDQSLQIQAEAQSKLMDASYAGQFITDAHGYITQPNFAFSAYTGLTPETLQGMTYIEWLQKQVVFRVPFDSVMKALLDESCWSGEVQLTPSANSQYHAVLSLSMMTDENRNIEHFIGVLQDITDIQEARNEIERLAYYDELTGLANRTLLNNHLVSTLNNQPKSQSFSGLILLDLDNFKMINDTLGHAIGDQLLILVSQKISALTSTDDLVARLDGDEFAILLKEVSQDFDETTTHILSLAHKIRESLADRYNIKNRSLHITASIGVYLFNRGLETENIDQIIRHANLAMHEAKNLGGNQAYLFEDKLSAVAKQRLEMLQALNHSELDDEFQLYFQAQVDSQGKTVGAETLLRWFHPSLGLVPPGQFIPVAEEGRQIIKIGLWVMHKAFLQAKAWNKKYGDIRISINISPIQFHEQSFVELVIGLVKFTLVNPNNITLELTEGVLIRNTDLALQKIQHLVSLGFHISIDDFGTGYSSLSYLQKLPIHELKIDQSFIRHIPENPDDMAIVESIVRLAQTKSLNIVAEGVENQQQAEFIRQQHQDILIQGYYYSKPCPALEFEQNFLVNHSK
ncbi:hypothetical protein THMIRHAM_01690 [Thiomicrorhabdus immobilis]|uniref:EAL domain-containing protein n=1 Tax=Thiomicrorhabdus immobilis TaxID=2791037 RepID=A0ABM7MAL5_9GAMM|nr:EAL domain-containing protein [Thiomicrorhabdus immobilis]BCN92384.1 hypothetical protein THMIRHAM_01690 [Thiomicrorhabdus immobilis]